MASAAGVAATSQEQYDAQEQSHNALCGRCRCDSNIVCGRSHYHCLNGLCGPNRCDGHNQDTHTSDFPYASLRHGLTFCVHKTRDT